MQVNLRKEDIHQMNGRNMNEEVQNLPVMPNIKDIIR
jgi:hypothetical protein